MPVSLSREIRESDRICPVCGLNWMPQQAKGCLMCACPQLFNPAFEAMLNDMAQHVQASTWHTWLGTLHYHGVRLTEQHGLRTVLVGCNPGVIAYVERRFGNMLSGFVGTDYEYELVPCDG